MRRTIQPTRKLIAAGNAGAFARDFFLVKGEWRSAVRIQNSPCERTICWEPSGLSTAPRTSRTASFVASFASVWIWTGKQRRPILRNFGGEAINGNAVGGNERLAGSGAGRGFIAIQRLFEGVFDQAFHAPCHISHFVPQEEDFLQRLAVDASGARGRQEKQIWRGRQWSSARWRYRSPRPSRPRR